MLGINRQWKRWRALVSFLTAVVLVLSLVSCGDRALPSETLGHSGALKAGAKGAVTEVSPPEAVQQLRSSLEVYKPQISIIAPHPDEVFQDTTVKAQFQVQDLPIFKDSKLGLGPHLQVILDNQPGQEVYDLSQPLVFNDLAPGTHSLRVFASRPWHESFKNEGAYAQTTFHIFTKTPDNNPSSTLPLLTYSRPLGSYGAEPILLDFYLTNAPLHLVAQEKPNDQIADWRIRVTVNGQSFVLERWQPIYLKGFKPGKSWVQLEFLDEKGNPVNNVFNNTVRLITYKPNGKDPLSKLVRGELSAENARSIVELNYTAKPTFTPPPVETPTPPVPVPPPSETPTVEVTPTKSPEPVPTETNKQSEKSRPGGFFNRFQERPSTQEPAPAPEEPVQPDVKVPPKETPISSPSPTPSLEDDATPSPEPALTETKQSEKPESGGFFNRFSRFWQRPATQEPNPAPIQPEEVIPTPAPEESVEPQTEVPPPEETPTTLPSSIPSPQEKLPPVSKSAPKTPKPESKSLPSLEKIPTAAPVTPPSVLSPTLPEIIATPSPEPIVPDDKKPLEK